jgi:diaminopimelate epimerase
VPGGVFCKGNMHERYSYTFYSPGGNDTALVEIDAKPDEKVKKLINSIILSEKKNVEQVGFIWQESGQYNLEMAGGEFCGNASRCAIGTFLGGQNGEIKLRTSGITVEGGVIGSDTWVKIPIVSMKTYSGLPIIEMTGITHLLIETPTLLAIEDAKLKAKRILKENVFLLSNPAVGVMFYQLNELEINLQPLVWVRDIETFYYETACGSGSAALGYFLFKTLNIKNFSVQQPSGKKIEVKVNTNSAIISGQVESIEQNELYL